MGNLSNFTRPEMRTPYIHLLRNMKHLLLTVIGVLFYLTSSAQINVPRTSDWHLIYEDSKIQLYSTYTDCNYPEDGIFAEYVLLRAINKTSQTLQLNWYNDAWFQNKGCLNCDHTQAESYSIILKANSSWSGNCEDADNIGLRVFSKWLRTEIKTQLEKLVVSELTTTPVK